jgi:cell shape-determining protein MreC
VSVEQRIINVAEKQNYYDSRELRAIALEVRKREDRIKQLEYENDSMRADLLLWKESK